MEQWVLGKDVGASLLENGGVWFGFRSEAELTAAMAGGCEVLGVAAWSR